VPHFGELEAMLGTLRGDGAVVKRDNALYVDAAIVPTTSMLTEGGDPMLAEDGQFMEIE
jgi:hypothetical protein